jgi:hypothetical protein
MDVSNIDGDLSAQADDAIAFLRRHQTELARLARLPGATDRRLDFGYDRRNVAVQCDYLPPELLASAGALGIGIELSLYEPLEETETLGAIRLSPQYGVLASAEA